MNNPKGVARTEEEVKSLKVEVSIEFETTLERLLMDTGVEISKLTEWSPSMIIDIFQFALEDSNAHTFNEALTELRERHGF